VSYKKSKSFLWPPMIQWIIFYLNSYNICKHFKDNALKTNKYSILALYCILYLKSVLNGDHKGWLSIRTLHDIWQSWYTWIFSYLDSINAKIFLPKSRFTLSEHEQIMWIHIWWICHEIPYPKGTVTAIQIQIYIIFSKALQGVTAI
jgi:hypothetical protein